MCKLLKKGSPVSPQAYVGITRRLCGVPVRDFIQRFIWYFPKIRGPQYRPQNTIILNIGTPKKVPLILGNPHFNHGPKSP